MKNNCEAITYLDGLRSDYDEYYAKISEEYPFRKDLLSTPNFSPFRPERLNEKTPKGDAIV